MISRHRVDRWGWFALRSAAVLVGLAGALLFPALALAQSVPNVVGVYRGFAQNIDPSIPPVSVLLTIGRQDEEGNIFGVVFILPYLEEDSLYQGQGKLLDAQGSFKLRGTNSAGKEVRVTGTIQGLVHQGALLLASYRSTPATGGPVDQGVTNLLRSFVPPDPVTPFTGTWRGTFVSDLNRQQGTVDLQITKQDGTSFEGVEIFGGIQACTIVGTIDGRGHFVYIGFGDAGRVLVGGQLSPPPDDGLNATYFRNFVTGAVDLGTFTVNPER